MHRFGRITAYIVAATLITTIVATAQEQPGLTVQRLSETVYVLMGEGGNIGVSTGADGTFIIDDSNRESFVRREAAEIVGEGLIGLGRTVTTDSPGAIRFKVTD